MPTLIRSCRIGLLVGMIGACVPAMAATQAPDPDGSSERPYPHLRQAAIHVVETARSALANRGEPSGATPLVTVAHTKAVSPELVDAVRDVFSGAGERQTAGGAWLEVILETQNSQQSGAYTPAPRAGLEQADLVLALDEAQAASGLTHVRGALLTLRASGPSEQGYGAGEIVPGSATSVYVQAPDSVGLVVRGEGYCNRSFPVRALALLGRQGGGGRCGGGARARPRGGDGAGVDQRRRRPPGGAAHADHHRRVSPQRRRREQALRSFELPRRGDPHRTPRPRPGSGTTRTTNGFPACGRCSP